MGQLSNLSFEDVQAEDNRRQRLGVGVEPVPGHLGKHDPELIKLFHKYLDETKTSIDEALPKFREEHPDFVVSDADKKAFEEAKKDGEKTQKLMEEAAENEYKVTDTSTGLPKAPPVYTDDEKEAIETRKKALAEQRKRELSVAAPVATGVTVSKTATVSTEKK